MTGLGSMANGVVPVVMCFGFSSSQTNIWSDGQKSVI